MKSVKPGVGLTIAVHSSSGNRSIARRRVVTSSWDKAATIWDSETSEMVAVFGRTPRLIEKRDTTSVAVEAVGGISKLLDKEPQSTRSFPQEKFRHATTKEANILRLQDPHPA